MKKSTEKSLLLNLMFVSLSIATAVVQAEEDIKFGISTYSAGAILEHNNRLLYGTTIGVALVKTSNKQAKELYTQALRFNQKATNALQSGKEELAKEYALESIHTIYRSDRQHYNLAEN